MAYLTEHEIYCTPGEPTPRCVECEVEAEQDRIDAEEEAAHDEGCCCDECENNGFGATQPSDQRIDIRRGDDEPIYAHQVATDALTARVTYVCRDSQCDIKIPGHSHYSRRDPDDHHADHEADAERVERALDDSMGK